MIKRILLGLLLLPCAIHAMEEKALGKRIVCKFDPEDDGCKAQGGDTIEKHEDDEGIRYKKLTNQFAYIQVEKKGDQYFVTREGFYLAMSVEKPEGLFRDLAAEYVRRHGAKKVKKAPDSECEQQPKDDEKKGG